MLNESELQGNYQLVLQRESKNKMTVRETQLATTNLKKRSPLHSGNQFEYPACNQAPSKPRSGSKRCLNMPFNVERGVRSAHQPNTGTINGFISSGCEAGQIECYQSGCIILLASDDGR